MSMQSDSPAQISLSKQVYRLVVAVVGNAFLAWIFVNALLNPADHAEFIVKTAALIFVIEFLAIHSGVFLLFAGGVGTALAYLMLGILFTILNVHKIKKAQDIFEGVRRYEKKLKLFVILIKGIIFAIPIAFYTAFAFSWGQQLNNLELPLYFGISLVSKYFSKKGFNSNSRMTREEMLAPSKWTMWFLAAFFIPAGFACQVKRLFPFPEEVYFLHGSSWVTIGSSPCLGEPHQWVIWGVLYYGLITIIEAILGVRRLRRRLAEKRNPI